MSTSIEIKNKVLDIIVKTINNNHDSEISTTDVINANSLKDVNLDSLTAFELLCYLEDEFGVEIPTEDAEQLMSFESAVNYIENKLS